MFVAKEGGEEFYFGCGWHYTRFKPETTGCPTKVLHICFLNFSAFKVIFKVNILKLSINSFAGHPVVCQNLD